MQKKEFVHFLKLKKEERYFHFHVNRDRCIQFQPEGAEEEGVPRLALVVEEAEAAVAGRPRRQRDFIFFIVGQVDASDVNVVALFGRTRLTSGEAVSGLVRFIFVFWDRLPVAVALQDDLVFVGRKLLGLDDFLKE